MIRYLINVLIYANITVGCVLAQPFCGFEPDSSIIEFHKKFNSNKALLKSSNEILFIPVKVHNLIKDNGIIGKVSKHKIENAFDIANNVFISLNIQFYQCGDIHYIRNSIVYEDKYLYENVLDEGVNNMFNLFIVNKMSKVVEVLNFERDIRGTGGGGAVIIEKDFLDDAEVLIHEIGHGLSLQHTFGTAHGEKLTDELVNGSNCHTSGDFICDTPADHFLLNKENSCSNIVGRTDVKGSMFDPLDNNFMAYYTCDDDLQFTTDQMLRMYYFTKMHLNTYSCPDEISNFDPKLTIYPNPSSGSINLNFLSPKEAAVDVYLYNSLGEECHTVLKNTVTEGSNNLSLTIPPEINNGFYLLGLKLDKTIHYKKIIVIK